MHSQQVPSARLARHPAACIFQERRTAPCVPVPGPCGVIRLALVRMLTDARAHYQASGRPCSRLVLGWFLPARLQVLGAHWL